MAREPPRGFGHAVTTPTPIDYACELRGKSRAGGLGGTCLVLSVAGIVLGLSLLGMGALLGFGAKGGGPGILVAVVGVILGPRLSCIAFLMGIVALFQKGRNKRIAVVGIVLSGIIAAVVDARLDAGVEARLLTDRREKDSRLSGVSD